MAKYKINFKDAKCQFVETYSTGKYGDEVKIYFCEGDEITPKGYSASVGMHTLEADNLNDLKSKIDRAVTKRNKELDLSVINDSKKKVKAKDKEEYSYYQVQYAYDNEELSEEFNSRKEAIKYYNNLVEDKQLKYAELKKVEGTENNDLNDERVTILKSFSNDSKVKDCGTKDSKTKDCGVKDSYGDWEYSISCEGNVWDDGGFESAEEAEDEAIAKVNELLSRHFPEDYAVDDFDITITNTDTEEEYLYNPYVARDGEGCTNCKDTKVKDASADEIIDLFHTAYAKGRTWDWLKNKLPSTFLTLYNRHTGKNLFPIQADRQGNLFGVYLTKPKKKSEAMKEQVAEFVDAIKDYMNAVEQADIKYNLKLDSYDLYNIEKAIKNAQNETDSRKEFAELGDLDKQLTEVENVAYELGKRAGLSFYSQEADELCKKYSSEGREALIKYLLKKIDSDWRGREYLENQKKPIIYSNKGDYIRSDSKVGPLTPEAEEYIRRIMKGASTEDIQAKRKQRSDVRNSTPSYFSWYRNNKGNIPKYARELDKLGDLLKELKREVKKEKKLGITLHPDKDAYKYVGQGKGEYDYRGSYKYNGDYVKNGRTGNSVEFDIAGLDDLAYVLGKVLNSANLNDMQDNLQEALAVVNTLPRNNPKVAEIRAKIKELLDKRKNAPVNRRPLPDKKFVKDSKSKKLTDGFNSKELKEFMDLCKQLNLNTMADVQEFAKKYNNAKDQDLLVALREEAKKQNK